MNAETIEKIQALVHAAQIGNPGTDTPSMLVPTGYMLESLEYLQDAPSRFRGTFATHSIEDFARYVNDQQQNQTFVDPDDMSALAFFDLGESLAPGHGEHRARLTLQKTAAYQALLNAHGNAFGQKDLAHWIEDWHHVITGEDSHGNPMSAKELANAVRRVEVKASSERTHEDGDWNSKRSGLDALDASTGQRTPSVIHFACKPYEFLTERGFEFRVSILTDDAKPRIKLRLSSLDAQQEDIAKEFKTVLQSHLEFPGDLLLGTFTKK